MAEKKQSIVKKRVPELFNKREQATINTMVVTDRDRKSLTKDRLAKKERWMILKEEYSELKKIIDLSEYSVTLVKAVANKLDIPLTGIDVLGGNPYINKTGLLYRLQKDPRKVKKVEAIPIILPIDVMEMSKDEDGAYKKPLHFSKDKTAMFKGYIEFQDGSSYSDIGTANPIYLSPQWNKMSTMIPYVIELASTRAINRTIRLATGVGLVSVEELNESVKVAPSDSIGLDEKVKVKVERTKKEKVLIEQIEKIMSDKKYNQARLITLLKKYNIDDLQQADEKKLVTIKKEVETDNNNSSKNKEEVKKVEKKKTLMAYLEDIEKIRKRLKMNNKELDDITSDILKGKELTVNSVDLLISELQKRLENKSKKRKEGK